MLGKNCSWNASSAALRDGHRSLREVDMNAGFCSEGCLFRIAGSVNTKAENNGDCNTDNQLGYQVWERQAGCAIERSPYKRQGGMK